jgi:hypothetical protein
MKEDERWGMQHGWERFRNTYKIVVEKPERKGTTWKIQA